MQNRAIIVTLGAVFIQNLTVRWAQFGRTIWLGDLATVPDEESDAESDHVTGDVKDGRRAPVWPSPTPPRGTSTPPTFNLDAENLGWSEVRARLHVPREP